LQAKSEQVRKTIDERMSILTKTARKVLNNKNVRFTFNKEMAAVEEKSKKLFLVKDKFKHYLEKNESLNKLVSQFNLEI
jgi:hypothetical protein